MWTLMARQWRIVDVIWVTRILGAKGRSRHGVINNPVRHALAIFWCWGLPEATFDIAAHCLVHVISSASWTGVRHSGDVGVVVLFFDSLCFGFLWLRLELGKLIMAKCEGRVKES